MSVSHPFSSGIFKHRIASVRDRVGSQGTELGIYFPFHDSPQINRTMTTLGSREREVWLCRS